MRVSTIRSPLSSSAIARIRSGTLHLLGILVILGGSLGSSIKSDETTTFFQTYASQTPDGEFWNFHIHAWVYEPEEGSRTRGTLLKHLADRLGLQGDEAASKMFIERARYFIVDNERGKSIPIRIAGNEVMVGPSEPNGHIHQTVKIRAKSLLDAGDVSATKIHVLIPGREFSFEVPLIGANGISVISDLDDTIKISEVASRRALLQNTFLREFRPVPEMAALYQEWEKKSAAFHYVSASPWQLYPPVHRFLETNGFPRGSLSMKSFRWKDSSFFDLFVKNDEIKRPFIESIFRSFPERKFILVGDTGELDASLYASLARAFPKQVWRIYIRNSTGEDVSSPRWKQIFDGIPAERWRIFLDPKELVGDVEGVGLKFP